MENQDERLKVIEEEQIKMVELIKILSDEVKKPKPPFPRILLKKSSLKNGQRGWELGVSSSEDKEEMLKIVKTLKEVDNEMENKFGKKI